MNKVLLVNDSNFENVVMKDMLNGMGYIVECADEYGAMKAFEGFGPDCAIVNLTMKQTKGHELISKLRCYNPGIKCILFSNNVINVSDFDIKVDDVFQTPIGEAGFRKIMDRLMRMGNVSKLPQNITRVEKFSFDSANLKRTSEWDNFKKEDNKREDTKKEEVLNNKANVFKFCPFCGGNFNEDMQKNGFAFCPFCGKQLK